MSLVFITNDRETAIAVAAETSRGSSATVYEHAGLFEVRDDFPANSAYKTVAEYRNGRPLYAPRSSS